MSSLPTIDILIAETNKKHEAQSGHSRLWGWFGLSRAGFLVLPRLLMHAMPDEWQRRMAVLLEEYADAYPNHPADGCHVCHRVGNRYTAWPDWLLNYRYPDEKEIENARRNPSRTELGRSLCEGQDKDSEPVG